MADDRERDEEIETVLASWRERRDEGEIVAPEEILAAHPHLAESLRARFEAIALLDDAKREARDATESRLRRVPGDRYSDFRVLGQGGMGIVYWALDTDLNRQVAFKVVRPDAGRSGSLDTPNAPLSLTPPPRGTPVSQAFDTLKARFLQEAWVTAGLEHPGIVPVYEVGATPEGVPYYTMRFIKGSRTFAAAIEEARTAGMDARLALLDPFLKICDTVRYAHAHGVIHRDLKPDNVALGEFGEVVVLDWGLAKVTAEEDRAGERWQDRIRAYKDAADLRTLASALGTPGYMAPEAALGRTQEVDERSDVYSLGAILFQILTGRLPFEFGTFIELLREMLNGTPPEAVSIDPAVPAELSNLCLRALSRNRDARPASVGALAEEVRTWMADRAAEIEVMAMLREAEAAWEGAEGLAGDVLVRQLDRLHGLCGRITALRPGHARATELLAAAEGARERAIAEREQAARGRTMRRAGVVGVAAAALGAAAFAWVVHGKKQEVESALATAKSETLTKEAALRSSEAERDRADAERAKAEAARSVAAAERDRARGLLLVHASADISPVDSALGLLLGRTAVERGPTSQAVSHLHAMLATGRGAVVAVDVPGQCDAALWSPDGNLLVTTGGDEGDLLLWTRAGASAGKLSGPKGYAAPLAISPDGRLLVASGGDGASRIWDVAAGTCSVFGGPNSPVHDADFSPKGDRIVTCSSDKTVRVWDRSGTQTAVFEPAGGVAIRATISADGQRILVSCSKQASLWTIDGALVATFTGHKSGVMYGGITAAVSPKGDVVATGGSDASVKLWRTDGTLVGELPGHAEGARAIAFSSDGTRIATGSGLGDVRVWSADGKLVATCPRHAFGAGSLAFLRDGRRLLSAGLDGVVRIADATGKELVSLEAPKVQGTGMMTVMKAIKSAAMSPDETRIFTSYLNQQERLWMLESGEDTVVRTPPSAEGVWDGAVAPDSACVATAAGTTVAIWNRASNEVTVSEPLSDITAIAVARGGDRVLVATETSGARLLDGAGRTIASLTECAGRVRTVAISPDGTRFVAGGKQGVCFWDREGRVVAIGSAHKAGAFISSVRWFPAGDKLVSAGWDGKVVVWDRDGKVLHDLAVFGRQGEAEPCPDGTRILVWNADADTASLIDLDGNRISKFGVADAGIYKASFSPSGDRVLTTSADGFARIWAIDGKLLATFGSPEVQPHAATFSSDGDEIVTVSGDGAARIWDAAARRPAIVITEPGSPIHYAVFEPGAPSPRGRRLITVAQNGTIRFWLMDPAALVARAKELSPRDFTPEERVRFADLLGE